MKFTINKKLTGALVAALSAFIYALLSPDAESQVGGGGVGGFPTNDYTLNGTLTAEQITSTDDLTVTDAITSVSLTATGTVQAEQITSTDDLTVTDAITSVSLTATGEVQAEQLTSTDDIDYNGVITNNVTDYTTFFEYIRYETSDFATDGSRLTIEKSSLDYAWNIVSSLTGDSNVTVLRFDPANEAIQVGESTDTVSITGVDVTAAEGSFTGTTVSSCTSEDTATIDWTRIGNLIIFAFETSISCTSDSSTFTIDGAPSGALPATGSTAVGAMHAVDNSAIVDAGCTIDPGGDITMVLPSTAGPSYVGSSWTTSGTKGIPAGAICTVVDNDNI